MAEQQVPPKVASKPHVPGTSRPSGSTVGSIGSPMDDDRLKLMFVVCVDTDGTPAMGPSVRIGLSVPRDERGNPVQVTLKPGLVRPRADGGPRVVGLGGIPIAGFTEKEEDAWKRQREKRQAARRKRQPRESDRQWALIRQAFVLAERVDFREALGAVRTRLGIPAEGFSKAEEGIAWATALPELRKILLPPGGITVSADGNMLEWLTSSPEGPRNVVPPEKADRDTRRHWFMHGTPPPKAVGPFTAAIDALRDRFNLPWTWRPFIHNALLFLQPGHMIILDGEWKQPDGSCRIVGSPLGPASCVRVLPPSKVDGRMEMVPIMVDAYATLDDVKRNWPLVERLQQHLQGHDALPRQISKDFGVYRRWYLKRLSGMSYMDIARDPEEAPFFTRERPRPSETAPKFPRRRRPPSREPRPYDLEGDYPDIAKKVKEGLEYYCTLTKHPMPG